jgi:CRISPR/Cas system-associated protein Cas5 (RAMP superfamily)
MSYDYNAEEVFEMAIQIEANGANSIGELLNCRKTRRIKTFWKRLRAWKTGIKLSSRK